jgi:putative ABC transport system ATP-binding protein
LSAIELCQVSLDYPGPPPVRALKSCDLRVESGEQVAIVGPSGSGKSTLLNVLGLLDRPTGGRYLLDGTDVAGLSDRERAAIRASRIGFVFQAFHLLPYRTAAENVALGQLYRGVARADRMASAHAALVRVGLAHRIAALPATMAGGERQRIAIARALVGQKDLLLCDEPTGNLDPRSADMVTSLLLDLHRRQRNILIVVTHSTRVADQFPIRFELMDRTLTRNDEQRATSNEQRAMSNEQRSNE